VERSFPIQCVQVLSTYLKHKIDSQKNGDDYVVRGNKLLKTKEFMNQFILDYKMYENTGVFQVSGIFYPTTYYTLVIGYIKYVNGIFNFITNNYCCMFDSGVHMTIGLRMVIQSCWSLIEKTRCLTSSLKEHCYHMF
jgi:hypothetical protein